MSVHRYAFRAGLFASVAFAAPALAQASNEEVTGDIIVTARRSEERLQEVPISISVYSQEQITNRNISTPSDLATYTPSLTADLRYGAEKASFTIRGFTQEIGTSPSVGVYFADVVAPRSQRIIGSGNGAVAGQLFDLQNVQVLKGPQGTLFGRNTTGGAVLIVPQKPTDRLEGYIEGSAGNYDMWRVQAVANIPLADTFKVRLGFERQKREGYMRNRSDLGPRHFNDLDYYSLRGSIVANLTPELENYTVVTYNNSSSNGNLGRVALCLRDGIVPGFTINSRQIRTAGAACDQVGRGVARGDGPFDVENSLVDPFLDIRQWQIINTTTWQASDNLTVKNIVSYSQFRERANFTVYSENFFVPDPPPPGVSAAFAGAPFVNVQVGSVPGEDNASQSGFTEELQLQGKTDDGSLVWQVGAYLELSRPMGWSTAYDPVFAYCTDLATLQCSTPFPGVGSVSLIRTKTSWTNKGLYAQATYSLTDKLSVTGGIRYTMDKVVGVGENRRFGLPTRTLTCNDPRKPGVATNPAFCHAEYPETSKRPTWLIGMEYKPSTDVMVYGKWARGYRQGGVNLSNISFETWSPEKVDTYEIGAKTTFRGTNFRGHFNIAAFYNDFTDQQILGTAVARVGSGLPGGAVIVNAGKSRIQGVEADLSARIFDVLQLDVGYAFLDTRLQSIILPDLTNSPFSSILSSARAGEPLPLSPKHRLTATAKYTLPFDESVGEISLGATYTYTAKQFSVRGDDVITLSNGSTIPTRNVFGIDPSELPPTHLVNLNVNWNEVLGQPIDAAFFVTNLTNKVYRISLSNTLNSGGFETLYYGPPRMWGFRLRYRFGH